MKICKLLLICLSCLALSNGLSAQNLYSEKINVCTPGEFCMDCGAPKATCDQFTLDYISEHINYRYNFAGGSGTIYFQVLVDPTGFSCVLSHSDATKSQLTGDIMRYLNGCLWRTAKVDGKPVRASVNVVFTIANGKISGKMLRMDLAEQTPPGNPIIYNNYAYKNPSLPSYDFMVWTRYTSPLPGNNGLGCIIDKSDILWYATSNGLARFDGFNFYPVNETNSPLTATTVVHAMATDKENNQWLYADKSIYMYNSSGWRLFDSTNFKISGAYRIIANPSGEVFFTNHKGLLIIRKDKLRLIDQQVLDQLPTNDVRYAYYDTRQRLWIGTTKGTIMIDKKQKTNTFYRPNTPLYNVCITNVVEDDAGNMYFSLHNYNKPDGDNEEEGLAVRRADGKWFHYNDKNSGMPSNNITALLYDKFEHLLWIGTRESGLVRFDLKDGWENYNNINSGAPGFDIRQLVQDSKGTIYVATANGMLRIKKK